MRSVRTRACLLAAGLVLVLPGCAGVGDEPAEGLISNVDKARNAASIAGLQTESRDRRARAGRRSRRDAPAIVVAALQAKDPTNRYTTAPPTDAGIVQVLGGGGGPVMLVAINSAPSSGREPYYVAAWQGGGTHDVLRRGTSRPRTRRAPPAGRRLERVAAAIVPRSAGRARRCAAHDIVSRMSDGQLILVGGALLAAGLAASLFAARFRVPALVLVLIAGMLIGSDGTGWIEFGDYEVARRIGIVALALILFEGGLAAGWSEIRPVLRPAVSLAVVGTILTALLTGFVASWLFDLSTLEGLLVGLDHRRHRRGRRLLGAAHLDAAAPAGATLEGESGLNDPVAVLLVLGFIDWIQDPSYGILDMVGLFAQQLSIGLAVGLVAGFAGVELLKRSRLASGGPVPGRDAGDRGDRVRRRRRAARLGLPRRLPRGPRARQPRDPGAPHGGGVPRGARLGRPGRDVLHARPARVPAAAGGRGAEGARSSPSCPSRSRGRSRRSSPRPWTATRSENASCWGGAGCAAPFRWCSRRSL